LLLWELRHAADPKHAQLKPVRGGLTGHQLRRIKEFVDVHISKEIGISELATLVGLSQFHFIRAFKRSVGLSPYQIPRCAHPGVPFFRRREDHGHRWPFAPPSMRRRTLLRWVQIALKPASKTLGLHAVVIRCKGLKYNPLNRARDRRIFIQ